MTNLKRWYNTTASGPLVKKVEMSCDLHGTQTHVMSMISGKARCVACMDEDKKTALDRANLEEYKEMLRGYCEDLYG